MCVGNDANTAGVDIERMTTPGQIELCYGRQFEAGVFESASTGLAMTKIADHGAYIAAAPEHLRPQLEKLHALLSRALPAAEEVIAYDMPGYRIGKTIIAGYAAFTAQCGLYVSPGAIKAKSDDIAAAGLKATKTGVKFSPSKPIPDELVAKLARASQRDHGL